MIRFYDETLDDIIKYLRVELKEKEFVEFEVLNPDVSLHSYSGDILDIENTKVLYRGYKAWTDLAQILFCKILTPKVLDDNWVVIRYKKLDSNDSFHKSKEKEEKYGVNSKFFSINKNEEPSFFNAYFNALKNTKVENRENILNLGVNSGDEFELIKKSLEKEEFDKLNLVGIDYCPSAIEYAKKRFEDFENMSFYRHDINNLQELNLQKADLIISIGTLQSSGLNFKELFMSLVQNYLKKDGAMILGFPNCRWIDGEMIYGAMPPNYNYSEMSILNKDIHFCKKYLQQKKFRVTVTGKDYIFLTATSINKTTH